MIEADHHPSLHVDFGKFLPKLPLASYVNYLFAEFCRDCGLAHLKELFLADIRSLSVVTVEFLYQITVFYNKTQHHFWELYLNDSIQCKFSTFLIPHFTVRILQRSA